jgi:hypothetical protein
LELLLWVKRMPPNGANAKPHRFDVDMGALERAAIAGPANYVPCEARILAGVGKIFLRQGNRR